MIRYEFHNYYIKVINTIFIIAKTYKFIYFEVIYTNEIIVYSLIYS